MADETEVIRQQMEETRESLAAKVEALENQVVQTVQGATSAVAETVEAVKEAVTETVDTVKETVQGTVETVKETVSDTVETVKETFNPVRQVEHHPWAALGVSVGAGFALSRLLPRARKARRRATTPSWSGRYTTPEPAASRPAPEPAPTSAVPTSDGASRSERGSGMLGGVTSRFRDELNALKGLAIGSLMGVVRQFIDRSVQREELRSQLTNVVDDFTRKLGGRPV